MKKILATAGAIAALALTSAPAQAATPTQQATATARIYTPLSITFDRNLDFGVVVLNNTTFAAEAVTISGAGAVSCGGGVNMTCSGSPTSARYTLQGSANASVGVTSPGFNLVNGGNTLAFTPSFPATVTLDGTGAGAFNLGGSINVPGNTPEGVYTGTFNVTANYQ
ncbi:DUF4402 domain-containing protein [Sphingomonas lutea]|uniref:DUF4402 domain-containing protein n=1 Tax=Sphingomonas lutea TaxID=1045317 RepID=A0A7G9SIJ3_9SPHN|nr:DUF4402 domain-containing protein [Sphingomonas lutea]QNN67668.1 DUF4402 domain-containing protein [Sphingomonas lutea]